jgi:hypothetical protein
MSGREDRHKTKYFGLGGGFGMVDMILGGVVLESRRNSIRPSCTSGGIVSLPLNRSFFLGA